MPSRRPLLALLLALLPRFSAFDMYRPWNSAMLRRLSSVIRVAPTLPYSGHSRMKILVARSSELFTSTSGTLSHRRSAALNSLCWHHGRDIKVVRCSTSLATGGEDGDLNSPASPHLNAPLLRLEPPSGAASPFHRVVIAKLSAEEAEAELAYLSKALLYHDWLYYNGNGAEIDAISDAAFDKLERRAIKLEQAYPELALRYPSRSNRVGALPSQNITAATSASLRGGEAISTIEKTLGTPPRKSSTSSNGRGNGGKTGGVPTAANPHLAPMLSLDNALTEVDLKAWLERLSRRLTSQSAISSNGSSGSSGSGSSGSESSRSVFDGMSVRLLSEPKIDGLSLSLRYVDGALVQAATRGDGSRGDDVTAAALLSHAVPSHLPSMLPSGQPVPSLLEVRGEVYLPKSVLPSLNAARVKEGLLPFANARNAAAGTLRASDHFNGQMSRMHDSVGSSSSSSSLLELPAKSAGAATAARLAVQELSFFAYDLFAPTASTPSYNGNLGDESSRNEYEKESAQPSSHAEIRNWLQSWGFMLPGPSAEIDLHLSAPNAGTGEGSQDQNAIDDPAALFGVKIANDNEGADVGEVQSSTKTAEALTALLRDAEMAREGLGYDVDGVVFKVDSWAQREMLGCTARAPRWAIAAKFDALQRSTILEGIEVQVGRSGVLTPVAHLAPVLLGGAFVRRATLHNAAHVAALQLQAGDLVLVQRAGDVIPQVVRRVSAGVGDAATNRTGSAADALAAIAASGEARRDDLAVEAEERRRFDGVSGAATTIIPWTMPLSCPVCSAPVVADGMAMRCSATSTCPAQTVGQLIHSVGRKALDIRGIGKAKLAELQARGVVRDVADLANLRQRMDEWHREQLEMGESSRNDGTDGDTNVADSSSDCSGAGAAAVAQWSGWGPTSVEKVLAAAEAAAATPLPAYRLLYALGLPGVGITTAQQLLQRFNGSFDALWDAMLALSTDNEARASDGGVMSVESTSELEGEDAGVDLSDARIAGIGAHVAGAAGVDDHYHDVPSDTSPEPRADPKAAASLSASEAISSVPGIGPSVLASLSAFSKEPANVELINKLRTSLNLIQEPKDRSLPSTSSVDVFDEDKSSNAGDGTDATSASRPLSGWCLAFTGKLVSSRWQSLAVTSRADALQVAHELGGANSPLSSGSGGVTKSTTHLVVCGGKKGGGIPVTTSAKAKKAVGLGVEVLSEEEFLVALLGPEKHQEDA